VSFRDGPFNDIKVPLTWTAAVAVIVAIVVGAALLVSDRRESLQSQAYGVSRQVFDAADKPVAGVAAAPAHWGGQVSDYIRGYFFAMSENRKLRQQVAELQGWRDTAIALQDANARYKAILGLKTDPPIPMVTGRVVLDSRGPFAATRLANVGVEKGVKVGNPVMSDRGLVGRVVGVTRGASRVLLLTDVASRTPVLVDTTDARAILLGDGGSHPRLSFLRGQNPVKRGDRILTSGDGGVFPRGLPVGVAVKGLDGQWRVQLDSDLTAIDFVRILRFKDFTDLVDEKQLDTTEMPPLVEGAAAPARTVSAAPKPAASKPVAQTPPASRPSAPPPAASAAPKPRAANPVTRPSPPRAVATPPTPTPTPPASSRPPRPDVSNELY
jgi:rod shape-determining protein MreC